MQIKPSPSNRGAVLGFLALTIGLALMLAPLFGYLLSAQTSNTGNHSNFWTKTDTPPYQEYNDTSDPRVLIYNTTANPVLGGRVVMGSKAGGVITEAGSIYYDGLNNLIQIGGYSGAWAYGIQIERDTPTGTLYLDTLGRVTITSRLRLTAVAFAGLAGLPGQQNGEMVYCSNCTIASPCAGGGGGAIAKRLSGIWECN